MRKIDKPEYFWHITTKIFGAGAPELRETNRIFQPGDQIISGGLIDHGYSTHWRILPDLPILPRDNSPKLGRKGRNNTIP